MERRAHQRFPTLLEMRVTVISDGRQFGPLPVSDVSKTGIGTVLSVQLAPGDLVRIAMADSSLFGHVVYSRAEGSSFRTGIEVQRVLMGGTDLAQLLHHVLRDAMPGVPGVSPSEVHLG